MYLFIYVFACAAILGAKLVLYIVVRNIIVAHRDAIQIWASIYHGPGYTVFVKQL